MCAWRESNQPYWIGAHTHGLNNVPVFEATSISNVKHNRRVHQVRERGMKYCRYANLDDDCTQEFIKNLENLGTLCRAIPDICRLNKVISRSKDLSRVISHWNCVYSENGRATTPGGLAPSSVEDGARPPSCFCRAIRSPPAYCSIKDEWNEPVR